MYKKVGLGFICCDRLEYTIQSLTALKLIQDSIDFICIINDGYSDVEEVIQKSGVRCDKLIQHYKDAWDHRGVERPLGARQTVSYSKNQAFTLMLNAGCEHLFLLENDILIKDISVIAAYIKTAETFKIQHLNMAYHGPANKTTEGKLNPKIKFEKNGSTLALYQNCVGAFSYYTKEMLEKVGLFDLGMRNLFDHVEHTYRCAKQGYTTPFWWFADVADSDKYFDEIAGSIENSSIPRNQEWQDTYNASLKLFIRKHNMFLFHVEQLNESIIIDHMRKRLA